MAKKGQKNKQHPQNITHKLMIEQHQHHENHVILIGTFQRSEDWPSGGEWRVIGAWSAIWVTDDGIMLIQNVPTYVWTRHDVLLGTDHLTCRWGLWFFVSFRKFVSDNTRVRIFIFFQNSTLGCMTKTLNQIIFVFLHQNQNIFFSNIGNQNI